MMVRRLTFHRSATRVLVAVMGAGLWALSGGCAAGGGPGGGKEDKVCPGDLDPAFFVLILRHRRGHNSGQYAFPVKHPPGLLGQ